MKRKLFFVAMMVILLSLFAYGTLAYYTGEATAHNVITSSGVDITLKEWADEAKTKPFPKEGVSGVMPNTSVTKIVEVENTGPEPVWVRVKVTKDIILDKSQTAEANPGLLIIECNKTDWTLKGDYYYYNEALAPGETTTALFAEVKFDAAMGNEYKNATATVDVLAQSVQTAHNGDSALEANGWPEETKK